MRMSRVGSTEGWLYKLEKNLPKTTNPVEWSIRASWLDWCSVEWLTGASRLDRFGAAMRALFCFFLQVSYCSFCWLCNNYFRLIWLYNQIIFGCIDLLAIFVRESRLRFMERHFTSWNDVCYSINIKRHV